MSVIIKNKPISQDREEHLIYDYHGFIDSNEDFFLITESGVIVSMTENFPTYNDEEYNQYSSIENFLASEFDTRLVRVYEQNNFDILIDLKEKGT